MKEAVKILTVLTLLVSSCRAQDAYLPFIMLNMTEGVETLFLPRNDDGVSEFIFTENPIPFGNSIQHYAYVTSHGVISFGAPFYVPVPNLFPSEFSVISNAYLVAPFWSDIDIRVEGDIFYEVHERGDITRSNDFLDQVSGFLDQNTEHPDFQGTWMLVAQWDNVHPWPHAISSDIDLFNYYQYLYYYFFGIFLDFNELQLTNTFQGVVITDGKSTYTVFTYQCGFMEWSTGGAVVGYNAAGDDFENHPSSGSLSIHNEVSCRNNASTGDFRNFWFRISFDNITLPDPPPTIEPPQSQYLDFLEFTGDNETRANRTVPPCDDCSLAVDIPSFPFGSYYHDIVYIGTNGIVSFGEEYSHFNAEPFPTELAASYYAYVVAPFWADADARLEGAIYYETHTLGDSGMSDVRLDTVNDFITAELNEPFSGNWMMVVTWDQIHPFPHGFGGSTDPYVLSTNTFQTVLITDGMKSYSVFTYRCGEMHWSDFGTIGFNAAGELFMNHPLTGLPQANAIACVHQANAESSLLNNVIYNLVPNPAELNGTTPAPPSSIGSCAAANYTTCCIDGDCTGAPIDDCFCDDLCRFFGDCCRDIDETCSRDLPTGNDTYLLFANHFFIRRVDPTGENLVTVVDDLSGGAFGIDYHHGLGLMFWSDFVTEEIYQANLDGSGMVEFVNTSLEVVDDVAVDWINDKLYWTDTIHARIEVADIMDSNMRKVLLRTGGNTLPRAIVVDPRNRLMYWSDWGETAMIERASMDGEAREVIVPDNLIWPNGITIDYAEDRLYWADANLDKIEYSNLDGTNRRLLETALNGVNHPFSITIENELVYWTEWQNISIFATHKTNGEDIFVITPGSLFVTPNGIEAVTPNRQPQVDNPCDGHACSHFCLLSSVSDSEFSCACPDGGFLNGDFVTCNFTGATPEPPEGTPGSCVVAGYDSCCTTGFCAGSPPSCLCDFNCHFRGDCCDDIDETCPDTTAGSCAAAGFTDCCPQGEDCAGDPATCFCDVSCLLFLDCCDDFDDICTVPTQTPEPPTTDYMPFLPLDVTDGVETINLPAIYAGSSAATSIPAGFPFGNSVQQEVYVNSIGVISFGETFADVFPANFPGFASDTIEGFLVAPYWSDNDISGDEGEVFYEVHVAGGTMNSDQYLNDVSDFISRNEEVTFQGTWMLVAQWELNHPWPYGVFGGVFYGDEFDTNTYQALVITDGTESYAVYTYQCDFVTWSRGATIGYNAGGDFFENHALSAAADNAAEIDCANVPLANWTNVIYRLSVDDPVTEPPPPTIEPPQTVYLEFLERTTAFRLNGTVDPCDDCNGPEVDISTMPFPMGQYQHFSFFVGANGIISFGREFPHNNPAVFPTLQTETFYTYVAAPFWGDADTRLEGEVYYEVHVAGDNPISDDLFDRVNDFLVREAGVDFVGNGMLVVHWDNIPPFPHGFGFFIQERNTFQAVLITDGAKSYAVYTYMCGLMQWSDDGTIGWNAGGELYENHPLSGLPEADDIDCVHQNQVNGSVWNNVVFDLVPGELLVGEPTPAPLDTLASCVAANYTRCCLDGDCLGAPPREDLPQDCFCDEFCFAFFDCCHDISQTCGRDEIPFGNDTYLIFANNFFIRRINPDGSGLLTIIDGLSGGALGIEYHSSRGVMFWTDTVEDIIYQANLDGTGMRMLLNASLEVVEDLATDWVNNKLYFTDALHARIEVIDLDRPDQRVELLRTGGNTLPRSIVVDPRSRHMYWTDWGDVAMIEQASMDGRARTVVIDTDLDQPWGITIDYDENRLYWVDAGLAKIEYSNLDGTGRVTLETDTDGVLNPFAITIENNLLYWTETGNVSIFTTHKVNGKDILALTDELTTAPGGIEAVTPGRQPQGIENPCDGNPCSDVCLLSSAVREGYTCACPRGGQVMDDGVTCDFTNATAEPPVNPGSCVAAGYDGCCIDGFCAGTPPNCFCDYFCTFFGDCCSDLDQICTEPPTPPTPSTEPPSADVLVFLDLDVTDGVTTFSLGPVDDDSRGPIPISGPGFPFGNSIQTTAYVGSNGVISFGAPYFLNAPSAFPGFFSDQSTAFVVAPFWGDVDARMAGDIFYEVHEAGLTSTSDSYLTEVSAFISRTSSVDFQGTWMLVAQWDAVHPWPHGAVGGPYEYFYQYLIDYYGDVFDTNTYQGIVITDGNNSFAVFTYRCDLLQWSRGAVIGYNAAGDFFANHDFSGGSAENIDCINLPASNYSNVVYQLSIEDITITDPPPTIEPEQTIYLDFLARAPDAALNVNKTLPPCDDCSSPAYDISDRPFPLGEYYHTSFYVGNNGIVSMGREFPHHDAAPFPTMLADTFYTYAAAPFWGDADTRKAGEVYYEVHAAGTPASDALINQVNAFLQDEEGVTFTGTWMLVVHWNAVHPWPHGKPGSINPILNVTNTYQAVLITDGSKSYAVYIYQCGLMGWSDEATIGWNAGGELYANHPLSGLTAANEIACVHQTQGSDLNNVVYDLVPGDLFPGQVTPPPLNSTGSCVRAGFTQCCDGDDCTGSRDDCSCNQLCYSLFSCCHDIAITCPSQGPGIVQNIVISAPSVDVLTITWDQPANVFFTITGYQVTLGTVDRGLYDELVNETTTQVTDLVRFTPYYISIVTVTESIGNSAEATAIGFTEEGSPIIAPSNLTLVRTSGTTMAVSWVPLTLEEAQGFVAGYDISYQPSGSVKRQVQTVRAPGDSSEITITGLDPTVGYTAAVAAATTVGSGPVSPPVASPATCPFQIHFFGADDCADLNSVSSLEEIVQVIVTRTESLCQCGFVANHIIDGDLSCNGDRNAITFRGAILDNDQANCSVIRDRVIEWVTADDTRLTIQGTELTTNTECPVVISSYDDSYCGVITSSAARAARIAAPTVVVVVVVGAVVAVVAVAIFLHLRRRKKTTYEVFGDESEVGSVNLTETGAQYKPVGASLKSDKEKEGILAFGVGEETGKVKGTEYQQIGRTDFQNPMYGIPVQQQERQREQQPTEPEYAKVDLAAKKKAEADEEADIEKMKLEMESATYEIPGPVENPYANDPVALLKAQEAGYEEPK